MLRQVTMNLGTVEGMACEDPAITVFRGIPFAQPPVDDLRWRAPQPVRSWDGMLYAHDFAPGSMQPAVNPADFYGKEWGLDPQTEYSEDSLYLNIWTPALQGSRKNTEFTRQAEQHRLPVMVWIYGGAYQCGTTMEKEFDGFALARHGVIVVTVAYRLNVFGFFCHPDLSHASHIRGDDEPVANFGMLDQQAALHWVRDHISDFGGDPNNVTLFGQSAGAASVLAQICSSSSDGLFQKAIMQSGAGLGVFNDHIWSMQEAQANGVRFLQYLGVDSVDAARRIPADQLLNAACEFPAPGAIESDDHVWPMIKNWIPCIDGRFLVEQYRSTIQSGRQHIDSMMVGNTSGEFLVKGDDGEDVPEGELGNRELTDLWISGGHRTPYCYRFDVQMPGDQSGAFHSSDLWFTFASLAKCWRPFEGWHYDLARRMSLYWTNFARNGDPNGRDADGRSLPHWDTCESTANADMYFGRCVHMERRIV